MIFDMLSTLCGCPSSSHRTIALVYGSQVDARQPATAQNMFWQLLFVVSLDNKRQVDHNVPVEATIVSTHARPRAAAAAMPPERRANAKGKAKGKSNRKSRC